MESKKTTQLIQHTGTVSTINDNEIIVDIERLSACATCESKSVCMTLNSKIQQIKCKNEGYDLKTGDIVTLKLKRSFGFYAATIAFIIPLFLFISTIIIFNETLEINEGMSSLAAFAVIALYYIIIHFFDYKISKKINFRIEKQIN
ncbi:MAG: SoxR reducing system RseC family protein [Prevotellaceae bacterium]|nr:SoxR reducing system RseC family protein [Prevotellaceae bacterium]